MDVDVVGQSYSYNDSQREIACKHLLNQPIINASMMALASSQCQACLQAAIAAWVQHQLL
jgi:hypothetical protein